MAKRRNMVAAAEDRLEDANMVREAERGMNKAPILIKTNEIRRRRTLELDTKMGRILTRISVQLLKGLAPQARQAPQVQVPQALLVPRAHPLEAVGFGQTPLENGNGQKLDHLRH